MGYYDEYLEHHGILGQKWGVRRFENAAGHLTAAGKNRYNSVNGEYQKVKNKNKNASAKVESTGKKEENKEEKKGLSDKQKKALKIAGAAVGTALVAYGGYKLYQKSVQTRAHAHMLATGNAAVNKAIAKENKTKLSAVNDYYDAISNNGRTRDGGLLTNPEFYKQHWSGVADRNISELNKGFDEYRKNAADIASDYKKSKAYLKSVKNRTNKNEDFTDMSNRVKAISSIGKTKKKSSSPPPIPTSTSKPKQLATSKLASEASSLARSVTAEGPRSFSSRSTQNSVNAVRAMTSQKLASATRTTSSGRQTTQRVMSVAGQQKFSQASQANSDLVNDLLRRNASMLSGR